MKYADIKKLATAFEKSDWDEIHLVVDGVEIHLSASADAAVRAAPPPGGVASSGIAATAEAPTSAVQASTAADVTPGHVAHGGPDVHPPPVIVAAGEGGASNAEPPVPAGTTVNSPTPGIFWRSPSPGAPPFVEVGQRVEPNTTVCIVEVMKLMQQVSAGVAGTVLAVLVQNGGSVEKDQPMVLIDEDA